MIEKSFQQVTNENKDLFVWKINRFLCRIFGHRWKDHVDADSYIENKRCCHRCGCISCSIDVNKYLKTKNDEEDNWWRK